MSRDVIIVGGGVIGCSIAWRLAQAGLKVTVFERGRVGCEASRAAAGMLSPQGESQTAGPFFDLCLRGRAMYRSFAEELNDASGIRSDVIIVGGGVIGCSIAWRLAQAGLKVTVFERGRVGCEASRAAAGMLSPQGESQTAGPFFDLCLRGRAMYRSFAEELNDASGI